MLAECKAVVGISCDSVVGCNRRRIDLQHLRWCALNAREDMGSVNPATSCVAPAAGPRCGPAKGLLLVPPAPCN